MGTLGQPREEARMGAPLQVVTAANQVGVGGGGGGVPSQASSRQHGWDRRRRKSAPTNNPHPAELAAGADSVTAAAALMRGLGAPAAPGHCVHRCHAWVRLQHCGSGSMPRPPCPAKREHPTLPTGRRGRVWVRQAGRPSVFLCWPCSLTWSLRRGSTPGVARSRATTGAWPFMAATCRGVMPTCIGTG